MRHTRCGLLAVVICSVLVACGGGGGGSVVGGSGGSSPYTGIQAPAEISNQNAVEIVSSALSGADMGTTSAIVPLSAETRKIDFSGSPIPLTTNIASSIRTVITSLPVLNSVAPSYSSPRPLFSETGSFPDPYGIGSLSYNITIDEVTYNFSGSLTYNNFHFYLDSYINGTVSISGYSDQYFRLQTYTISSSGITYVLEGQPLSILAFSYTESVTFDSTGFPITYDTTMTYYVKDDITGKVSWVDHYTIHQEQINSSTVSASISGRFYHPNYGYVDIVTVQPFISDYLGSYYPYSGILIFTGANNKSAKLTVLDSTNVLLEVDSDGNGTYEYSQVLPWGSIM
ncbi:MAG: hypothetical protein AABZ02_04535 [Bacteroidota bacterium]